MKSILFAGIWAALLLLVFCGCAADERPAAEIMQPTDCGLTGAFDVYLYVPLEGGTYRYERVDASGERVAKGEQIYSFVEDTGFDRYDWQVYALKEYPDLSHVWAECGPDYAQLYRYSPPKRSDDNALDMARQDGCVIMEDGDVTGGQDTWMAFVERTGQGKAASVKVAHYYTLNEANCDPAYYAACKEDYPVLYVNELAFDGNAYTLTWEEEGARLDKSYRYLMRFTGDAPNESGAAFDTYTRYVLTNDNTVTWEDLFQGMASSRFGDHIDHFAIYTDLERDAAKAHAQDSYGVFIGGEPACRNFLWESTYTEHGWLAADGMSVTYLLPDIAKELPMTLFDKALTDIEIRLPEQSGVSGVNVYNSGYERTHHRISQEEFLALSQELPPGEYYAAFIVVSEGRYIPAEERHEQRGEEYIFKLIIPEEEIG